MRYEVRIKKSAFKSLEKIDEPYYQLIKSAILNLAENPRPNHCKKLKGRNAYRIRVSDYRIIYDISDRILVVEVINIGHRKEVYK